MAPECAREQGTPVARPAHGAHDCDGKRAARAQSLLHRAVSHLHLLPRRMLHELVSHSRRCQRRRGAVAARHPLSFWGGVDEVNCC